MQIISNMCQPKPALEFSDVIKKLAQGSGSFNTLPSPSYIILFCVFIDLIKYAINAATTIQSPNKKERFNEIELII